MQIDNDNLPDEGGTGTDQPSETDNDSITDYWEPGDDEPQDTPTDGETETTDEGEGEAEGQPDEGETSEPEPEEPQPVRADATAKVALADGTETTVGELAKGHMRQADYSRKTQEVAEMRRSVEADANRIQGITQAFIEHLSTMIPDEPPHSLALSDPAAYTRQRAQHDAAVAQVQKLIEIGSEPKQVADAMSDADKRALMAEENRKLVEAFPETATQEGRKRFWDDVSGTAMELGFTADELSQVSDHRLFKLAYWARKGMSADKAKAEAKAKAAKAPPVAPHKPGQGMGNASKNAEAMRRLARTGSIHDAMQVDF